MIRLEARVILALLPILGGCALPSDARDVAIEELSRLTLEEELRIGSADDPDQGFSRVAGVRVSSDGRMFVLERQDLEVRVFESDGRLLRTIGRQGQGPGEFTSVNLFGLQGDTLWVLDQQSRRITLFSGAGMVLNTVPATGIDIAIPIENVRVNAYPASLRPDGLFDAMFNVLTMPGGRIDRTLSIPRVVFNDTGSPVDTAGFNELEPRPLVEVGGRFVSVASPLPEEQLRLADGNDSIVVSRPVAAAADEATFSVVRATEKGDTVFRRAFRYRPIPITPAARDSFVRERIRLPLRTFSPQDTIALRTTVESSMELPAFHPPVSAAQTGADGALWLRLADDGSNDWRWLVLSADGTARGVLNMPKTSTLEWMDQNLVWVVEQDAFDVPWVVRYRIAPIQ